MEVIGRCCDATKDNYLGTACAASGRHCPVLPYRGPAAGFVSGPFRNLFSALPKSRFVVMKRAWSAHKRKERQRHLLLRLQVMICFNAYPIQNSHVTSSSRCLNDPAAFRIITVYIVYSDIVCVCARRSALRCKAPFNHEDASPTGALHAMWDHNLWSEDGSCSPLDPGSKMAPVPNLRGPC